MTKLKAIFAFLVFCLSAGWSSYAQVSLNSAPVSWTVDEGLLSSLPFVAMDPVNVDPLLEEDSEALLQARSEAMRFAVKQEVNFNLDNSGRWTNLANGDRIWMMGIHSPDARSLSVTFSNFRLPKGAALFIYDPFHTQVIGALNDANNQASGRLTTSSISGDQIVLEYYEPYIVRQQGQLQIESIAHGYRDPLSVDPNAPSTIGCSENTACIEDPLLANAAASVVLITVDEGTHWCTGTLMNNGNFDGKPYVLANSNALLGDPASWHFTFRYRSNQCGGEAANVLNPSVSGSKILASHAPSSTALLELSSRPNPTARAFYAGWDASGVTPQKVTSIHHPSGQAKMITTLEVAPAVAVWNDAPVFRIDGWDRGATDEGSVGAPLFNEYGQAIGIMVSGFSNCENDEPDFYSRLQTAWSTYQPYLDPFDQGLNFLNGTYLSFGEIDDRIIDENIGIFPVPATVSFNVVNEGDEAIRAIFIYDLSGRLIQSNRYTGLAIDIQALPIGQYIVEIELETSRIRRPLIRWE
jgi:hypothetical protein